MVSVLPAGGVKLTLRQPFVVSAVAVGTVAIAGAVASVGPATKTGLPVPMAVVAAAPERVISAGPMVKTHVWKAVVSTAIKSTRNNAPLPAAIDAQVDAMAALPPWVSRNALAVFPD